MVLKSVPGELGTSSPLPALEGTSQYRFCSRARGSLFMWWVSYVKSQLRVNVKLLLWFMEQLPGSFSWSGIVFGIIFLVDTIIVKVCTSITFDASGKAGMKLLSVQMLWHPTALYRSQVFCLVLQAYCCRAIRKTSHFRACVWQWRCEACRGGHMIWTWLLCQHGMNEGNDQGRGVRRGCVMESILK